MTEQHRPGHRIATSEPRIAQEGLRDRLVPETTTRGFGLVARILVARGWRHASRDGATIWLCPSSGHWFSEGNAIGRSNTRREAGLRG